MIRDYLGNEITIGCAVAYAVGSSSPHFEHGIIIGIANESVLTRGMSRTKMKVARLEKQTWKWCTKTNRNIATGNEWKIKKVNVESPFRMLVIDQSLPGTPVNEMIEKLILLKAMFLRGEEI